MAEEKATYIVNSSFISYDIEGVVLPRGRFVAVSKEKLSTLKKNAMFASLLKSKDIELKDEIDDSMRTTEEQLDVSRTALIAAKQEAENLKEEALAEIKKRDEIIEQLKKELADTKKK